MSVLSERAQRREPAEATPGRTPARAPRWRVLLAAGLALVVAVCVALLVWLSAGGRAPTGGGLDQVDEREQVMSMTDQFVKRLGTYSPDMVDGSGQMPDYRAQVREVITPKFAADFDKEVAAAEQLVAQGRITRTADVFATAVSSIDDDSARVLVAGAFNDSYAQGSGKKSATVDQEPLPFRFTVDLVTIDGEWLVDDFTPVSSGDTPAGSGSGTGEGITP
ncbi:hypothetical protein ASC64_05855 [Nocardioides sp. Root122]|uniref:hypothetical protein n=1 Tax=Nocardioides TaxID=1839 RepID=UPI000702DAF8|nr:MULTISPECIES: hypothetical protein [Nocardioides]KQV71530.1 hypothetical protein ASC64_05855 [Nocardioides sp. Root122]MCK9822473.1 hypothetical protein [Nocardioides cavernae]